MPTDTSPVLRSDVLSLSTSDQVEIYSQQTWPRPFLRQLLFPRDTVFQTVAVQLSYRRFRRGLAPFIARYQGGRILPAAPASGQLVELPAFAPTRKIHADDALIPPGPGVWISPDATNLVASTVAQNWTEMELSHSTHEEWLCANLLSTGIIDLKGDEGGDFQLKFEINDPIACTSGGTPPAWNTTPEIDLITWLQTEARALAGKCGMRPDTLICGSMAAALFMANKSVQAERQIIAFNAVPGPTFEDQAVTFIGRYAGLNVYEYDGVYVMGDGQAVDQVFDMIAPTSAILASTTAAGAIVYGAINVVEDAGVQIFASQRVPHSWADKDNSLWTQGVSSRYCRLQLIRPRGNRTK
jgi:Phage major capsid protein E